MTENDRNPEEFEPEKKAEYRLFVIWRALPRDMGKNLWQKLGISDDEILELSAIKTQQEFAEKYGVREATLTDWKSRPIPSEYKQYDWRWWAKQATPSVLSALLRELRKNGDAPRFTAWMKYVEQVEEKTAITVDASQELFDQIKAIAESVKDD